MPKEWTGDLVGLMHNNRISFSMSEKEKRDVIIRIIKTVMLPVEIESELVAYVKARCPDETKLNDFITGAECMRHIAVKRILELEEGCLGIQKAAFVVARNAVEDLEIVGVG